MITKEKDSPMADLNNLQSSSGPPATVAAGLSVRWRPIQNLLVNVTPRAQLILVLCTAIFIASAVSHFVAVWLGLPTPTMIYRRIGPEDGPQVFCAGSSVVQFGLSWPEISEALGQGIENWGLGGSTPTEWEVSQSLATNTNLMIIGVSLHDLNEHFLCDSHANVVSITQTIRDIWESKADWQFSRRVLSQYPLAYLRILFPTAGKSDAILVGLRRKLRELAGLSPSAEDKGNFLVLPSKPVLDFGAATEKLSDWPADKTLRRLDLLRGEIHGSHWLYGPKHLAFLRMLDRAQQRGHVIVVVAPVATMYVHKFVTPDVTRSFEDALTEAQHAAPRALFVRLDQLPALNSDQYFSDFVHLNGAGRQIATAAFLEELRKDFRRK
jgi:hypothetical protein